VATDLFGVWLVDMSYGRIGTIGRSKIRSFATIGRSDLKPLITTRSW
jgi:predicted DNA-binding WGR domain protein